MRMDKVLLSVIAASVLCVVSSQVRRQYHFIYEPKTMTEAQSYCRENYTDLATIDSMEDVETLNNMRGSSKKGNNLFRIGLYEDPHSFKWSLSDRSFYKDGEMEFRRWKSGEPNNEHGREFCVLSWSGGWYADFCGNQYKAMCMSVKGQSSTFFFINKSMTWTEAQTYCRARYTDLVSVRNMTENQKVNELIPEGEAAWIGLHRYWMWSDGSDSSFRYWQAGEPDSKTEHCVVAQFGYFGRWRDWPCHQKAPFICYSPVPTTKQVIKLRLQKKSSSMDLNDPAVMEKLLEQLKQKMKDQGLKEDFKLSWRKQPDGKVFHKENKETKKKRASTRKDEL